MAIADLKYVLQIFGGSDVSADHENELFEEVLLMTLARAANADVSIQHVEVETIQEILKKHTGKDFSAADVRVAAREELYAEATLVRYLRGAEKKLTEAHCNEIVQALAEVFRSDQNVSGLEVDFFNNVVGALNVTPAQIAGLFAGDV
ncbi:MAG: TerB family tellurite resistance protein [Proteobacteria bacterium]|nr:TerB family tellurite resistance protein [Pseudomonadota bacterium]